VLGLVQRTKHQLEYKSSAVAEMGDHLTTTDMGQKLGAAVPPFFGKAESPSNMLSPGPRPTYTPSGILIIQPFGHNTSSQTDKEDRTDRTDNIPIAYDEPFSKRSLKNC